MSGLILITGSAGVVGSHITDTLIARGDRARLEGQHAEDRVEQAGRELAMRGLTV